MFLSDNCLSTRYEATQPQPRASRTMTISSRAPMSARIILDVFGMNVGPISPRMSKKGSD